MFHYFFHRPDALFAVQLTLRSCRARFPLSPAKLVWKGRQVRRNSRRCSSMSTCCKVEVDSGLRGMEPEGIQIFPFKRAPSRFLGKRSPVCELGHKNSHCPSVDTIQRPFPQCRDPHSTFNMLSICLVISLVTSLVSAAPTATAALGNSPGLPRCSVDNVKLVLPATAVAAGGVIPSNVKPVHVLLGRGVQVNRGRGRQVKTLAWLMIASVAELYLHRRGICKQHGCCRSL